jgi:hypothetical protein
MGTNVMRWTMALIVVKLRLLIFAHRSFDAAYLIIIDGCCCSCTLRTA